MHKYQRQKTDREFCSLYYRMPQLPVRTLHVSVAAACFLLCFLCMCAFVRVCVRVYVCACN